LPFTVLRRLDCTLESTKEAVLAEHAAKVAQGVNPEPFLLATLAVPGSLNDGLAAYQRLFHWSWMKGFRRRRTMRLLPPKLGPGVPRPLRPF
jgi:hypothetical protein